MLRFSIPIRLVSLANVRMHWAVKSKLAKGQRLLGEGMAKAALGKKVTDASIIGAMEGLWPYRVKITRVGKRKMDSDNLAISAKHVRDGIADALGVNDGDESKITWSYAQEIGKEYSVKVEIS